MSKKTYVVSDLHIGTNVPTNWYQKDIHEPYLKKIFSNILENANEGDELIILGDLFDFWTYPPNQTPPTAAEIIAANPDILGSNGLIAQIIAKGNVTVSYLRGNHDITTTQADLNLISDKITLQPDIYLKDGVAYMHGHLYTIFNAPDPNHHLPVGHFVTRALSYYLDKHGEKAANESGFGQSQVEGSGFTSFFKIIKNLIGSGSNGADITTQFLKLMQEDTGIPMDETIILPHELGTTTYRQVIKDYTNLFSNWITANSFVNNSGRGTMTAYKSAYADYDGSYMGWFAQQLALQMNVDLVVAGHTHHPKLGLKGGVVNYMNTGFECVPTPDMKKQNMTFGVVTTEGSKPTKSEMFKVTENNGAYSIEGYNPGQDYVISEHSAGDFSCYVSIINDSGEELEYVSASAAHGYFTVIPPKLIPAWETVQFWIQDNPGPHGSEGSVTYKGKKSGKQFQFSFECPTGLYSNKAHGPGDLYTKSGSVGHNWGNKDHVQGSGHPFFVKYVIDYDTTSNWVPTSTLSKLVETAGFLYDPQQDIIYSRMNPIQRDFGYAYNYDKFSSLMDFDIDCEPIFFEYNNKIWRIELWKGQYGLETGCEIGIYNRDPHDHNPIHKILDTALGKKGDPYQQYYYPCASNEDMLKMSFTLHKKGQVLFSREADKHWWLTGFKWGLYSEPTELTMDISITLKDATMTNSFVQALRNLNYVPTVSANTVSFTFARPKSVQPPSTDIARVKAANKALVDAYNALQLKSNDPNVIGDEINENMKDSVIGYGYFFKRMVDVAVSTIDHWLTVIMDLRNFKVMDFSTVVEFRNWSNDTLLLNSSGITKSSFPPGQNCGSFVISPPEKILPSDTGRLLIQDNFGVHGGEGWVKYDLVKADGTKQQVKFIFGCPTGVYNNYVKVESDGQLPANFINYVAVSGNTKSFDGAKPNETPHKGHPLHVRCTVGTKKPQPQPEPKPEPKTAVKLAPPSPVISNNDGNDTLPLTFYQNQVSYEFAQGDKVILSSTADGTGTVFTDDQIILTVKNNAGQQQVYQRDYSNGGQGWISTDQPQDITHLFTAGGNRVEIKLVDLHYGGKNSSGYYLVTKPSSS